MSVHFTPLGRCLEDAGTPWWAGQIWWAQSLTDPDAAVPAHQVFVMCAEASGTLGPWLADWEKQTDHLSDRRLAEAVAQWEYELLGDSLPWSVDWYENDEEEMRAELVAWLPGHAAVRLCESGASADLQHRIRLLGLTGEDRWTDPHWPGHRYCRPAGRVPNGVCGYAAQMRGREQGLDH
ncbi:hypothetical protein ACFTT0_08160 [Streptomyces bauhiniae]|uniref:hypothetical protein n=1 Tax=Streptomyces bauhiniae TaxID=2340725 RepID=UPI0036372E4D